jgi:HAD superfamily hydrolase (TIGR01459 family)
MNAAPRLLSGLREIAGDYDALVSDVWGVLHNGVHAFPPAVEALHSFRKQRGRVVLLSNAPRPPDGVVPQLRAYGVPDDCYDALVTSGGAARDDLAQRAAGGTLALLHIGPERDHPLHDGLDVKLTGAEAAEVVLCSGLYDDETETPEDYRPVLETLLAHGRPMICANPDLLVPRGNKLVYCAGAVAKLYEEMGGTVAYYGKPHPPIYQPALDIVGPSARVLVVGDALETDIAGANRVGLDVLFVTAGLHAREVGAFTAANVSGLLDRHKLTARAALEVLRW